MPNTNPCTTSPLPPQRLRANPKTLEPLCRHSSPRLWEVDAHHDFREVKPSPHSASSRPAGGRAAGRLCKPRAQRFFPSQIPVHLKAWLPSPSSSLHPEPTSPPSPLAPACEQERRGAGEPEEAPLAMKERKIY